MSTQAETLVEGVDYYLEGEEGLLVFTAHYLKRRGYCCGSGCRHCPYEGEEKKKADLRAQKTRHVPGSR